MRGELASFGTDVLLACAGFGVLLAVGLKPRGGLAAIAALGLAYLAGAAIVPLALTVLLVVGVPFTLPTFLAVVFVCVALGVVRSGSSVARPAPPRIGAWLRSWRSWPSGTWAIVIFVVAFGGFSVAGFLGAREMPMYEGDGWTIWARKAEILTVHSSLWTPFFTNPVYTFAHLDYPLQLPIWEAIHTRAAGAFEAQPLIAHVWLLLVAFIWALAYVIHVYGRVRWVVWVPLLLLLATAPAVWQQASGAADLPMAMFACVGAVAMALWLNTGDNNLLAAAAIMLAAAANTKNEGIAAAVSVLVVAAVIVLVQRLDWRAFLVSAAAVFAAGIIPWRIWLAAQGIEGDYSPSRGLSASYLLDHDWRVWPSVKAINLQLAEQGRWVYLVPLAALMIVAALVSGLGRRVAVFYLGAFALTWASFVWSYWISPYELTWHLETSVSRVVTVLILICAAAVVHLSGIFVAVLERRSTAVNRID